MRRNSQRTAVDGGGAAARSEERAGGGATAGSGEERVGALLLVSTGAAFMALLDVTVVNIAFPDMRRSFPETSLANLSWVVTSYAVLPPERFAAGSGMVMTARQLGGALGVATTAAILSGSALRGADAFTDVYLFCAIAALGTVPFGLVLLERPHALRWRVERSR